MSDFGTRPVSISCSNSPGGHYASHNDRTSKHNRENVNREYSNLNIVYKNQSLESAFEECFGTAKNVYNEKQKERDRKDPNHVHPQIENYIDYIIQSKNFENIKNRQGIQDEWVISVSDMWDQLADRTTPEGQLFYEELTKTIAEDLIARFPRIHFTQIIGHLDEIAHIDKEDPHLKNDPNIGSEGADFFSGFHIHLGGFFFADGYKKGMEVQYSARKAQQQMGFSGKDRLVKLQDAMMDCIEKSINKMGMIRLIMNTDHEHFKTPAEYKEYAKKAAQLTNYLQMGYEKVNKLSSMLDQKEKELIEIEEEIDLKDQRADQLAGSVLSLEEEISRNKESKKNLEAELVKLSSAKTEIVSEIVGDSVSKLEEAQKSMRTAVKELTNIEIQWQNENLDSFSDKKTFSEQVDLLDDLLNSMSPYTTPKGHEVYLISKKKGDLAKKLISSVKAFIHPLSDLLNRIWMSGRSWLRAARRARVTQNDLDFYDRYHNNVEALFLEQGEEGMNRLKKISEKIEGRTGKNVDKELSK